MNAEDEVKSLNELVLHYEEVGDSQNMKPLLAARFTIVRANGQRQDRDTFLSHLSRSRHRGRSIQESSVHVTGDFALYTCIVQVRIDAEGRPSGGRFFNSRAWVRENGQWRCLTWHVSKMPFPAAKDEDNLPDERAEMEARLREIVMEHLSLTRPGRGKNIEVIQDRLLPSFLETANLAVIMTSAYGTSSMAYLPILQDALKKASEDARSLDEAMESLGIYALLQEVASTPEVSLLSMLSTDPYELRLLRASGQAQPREFFENHLRKAAAEPQMLATPDMQIERAGQSIDHVLAALPTSPAATAGSKATAGAPGAIQGVQLKTPQRRLIGKLSKLFSGLTLIAGDAVFVPEVFASGSAIALPLLASLAAGIQATGESAEEILNARER